MSITTIKLTVNGQDHEVTGEAGRSLVDVLRSDLGLPGSREGCGIGICGACTVLVDGNAVRSCLMFAVQATESEITTVEGFGENGGLSPLQAEFRDNHALQCGFCTPGMLATATAFLAENPSPSRAQTESAISGNICRCTGYVSIIDAILEAGARLQSSGGK